MGSRPSVLLLAAGVLALAACESRKSPAGDPPASPTAAVAKPAAPAPPEPLLLEVDPSIPKAGPLRDRPAEVERRPWDNFKTHDPLNVNYFTPQPSAQLEQYATDFVGTLVRRGAVDFQLVHSFYRKGLLSRDDREGQVAKMVAYVEDHPEEPAFKGNLVVFLQHVGFEEESLALAQRWKSEPWWRDHWDANFYTGSVYFRRGEYALALPFLERAAELHPDPWAKLWLRLALAGQGDPETEKRREELFRFGPHMGSGDPKRFPFVDRSRAWGVGRFGLAGAVAFSDFDGDTFVDLVVNGVYGSPEYFRFIPGQGFERKIDPGLEEISNVPPAAVAADFDNDGFTDFYATAAAWFGAGPNRLLRNDSGKGFVNVAESGDAPLDTQNSCGAAALDFDRDGLLDLAVSGTKGGVLRILRNEGGMKFREVTEKAGMVEIRGGTAVSVAAGDVDGDGWPDLFVNVFGPNFLYLNQRDGTFREAAEERGVSEGTPNGFGSWMFDYDNDGDLDILASNFAITGLEFLGGFGEFPAAHFAEAVAPNGMFQPSALYRNDGTGHFEDVGAASGLVPASVMGAQWVDLDLDGNLDVVLGPGSHPLPNMQPLFVYRNRGTDEGGPRFENTTPVGDPTYYGKFHGIAFADVDRDGDPDLYVDNGGVMLADHWRDLFLENTTTGRRWLHLRLAGTKSNRSAVGARVQVKAGGRTFLQEVAAGQGFSSTNTPYLVFGLGDADHVDEVRIRWPTSPGSGPDAADVEQVLPPLAAGQALVVTEGSAELRRIY